MGAYLRSVFLQPNKKVFNVAALPYQDFAQAVGLASLPDLKILRRQQRQPRQDVDASIQLDSAPSLVTDREPTVPTGPITHAAASASTAHPGPSGEVRESCQPAQHSLVEEEAVRTPRGVGSARNQVGFPFQDGGPARGHAAWMGEFAAPLLQVQNHPLPERIIAFSW